MRSLQLIGGAAIVAAGLVLAQGATAQAWKPEGAGTFVVDLRATDVAPASHDPIVLAATGAATGLHTDVSDSVMPTFGFTYFLTDHLAVEAIAGFTDHRVYAEAPGVSIKALRTWVLPPVITLKYVPFPKARLSPYVGGGVNAMVFFAGTNYSGLTAKLHDNVGAAVQGGADYALGGRWTVDLDVKKVFVANDISVYGDPAGALHAKVHLSPLVMSVGLGHRF